MTRFRTVNVFTVVPLLGLAVLTVGCVSTTLDLSANHPARPEASAGVRADPAAVLRPAAALYPGTSTAVEEAAAAQAQWPETTVLVPVGSTRDIEFVADAPGDWAMHCHFTHHIMNQMGHEGPNVIGLDAEGLDSRIRPLLPGYMTMGQTGMAGMSEMGMPVPDNSIPMKGAPGKHDHLDMGGMFTVLKVRDDITSYEDPGWYENPPGTVARAASAAELEADGIEV